MPIIIRENHISQPSKSKRKVSAYNKFIGECLKSGKTMEECIKLYRKRKNGDKTK